MLRLSTRQEKVAGLTRVFLTAQPRQLLTEPVLFGFLSFYGSRLRCCRKVVTERTATDFTR